MQQQQRQGRGKHVMNVCVCMCIGVPCPRGAQAGGDRWVADRGWPWVAACVWW